jgi:hypothetical protein
MNEKEQDSEALKEIKKWAKEEVEFYHTHGYFSFWSDELKAQRKELSRTNIIKLDIGKAVAEHVFKKEKELKSNEM